jgi:hypothetical protein
LGQPVGIALAVGGAGLDLHVQFHQPLRREAEHLAHDVGIGLLGEQSLKGDHIIGHRGSPGLRLRVVAKPYRRSAVTTAVDKSSAAAGLVAVAASADLPTAPTLVGWTRPRCPRIRAANHGQVTACGGANVKIHLTPTGSCAIPTGKLRPVFQVCHFRHVYDTATKTGHTRSRARCIRVI